MRSEVMPTVMAQLEDGESGHHFSGQYKTKDIRALVDKLVELEHLRLREKMLKVLYRQERDKLRGGVDESGS